ncbi:MAG: hypothetical protein RR614_12670 [Eubacterium sp.]
MQIKKVDVDYFGVNIRKSFYGKTEKEALEKYVAYMCSQGKEEIDVTVTFSRWAEIWLEDYECGTVSDKTYLKTYVCTVNKLILTLQI